MTFNPRTTAPSKDNKYYIHISGGGYNKCIRINGYDCLPNCVGYAYGRFMECVGKHECNLPMCNAEDWFARVKLHGFKTGSEPKLGAVMCFRKGKVNNSSDGAGHVLIVEKIYADGSILCSQSGYKSSRFWTTTFKKPYKLNGYVFQGFIYNPDVVVEKKAYSGTFPSLIKTVSTDKAELLADCAESLAWKYGTSKSKWAYSTGNPTSACKAAMNERGYKSRINMSDCGNFMNTILYKALGKKLKTLAGTKEAFPAVDGFSIVHKGAVTAKSLKRGDIIRYKSKTGQHIVMYLGNGKIAEAGRGTRFGVVRKSAKYNSSNVKKSTLQVLRVNESKTTKIVALKKGDSRKEEIKKLQKFLNWYGGYGLNIDGIYGEKTYNAVHKFQLAVGLSGDGMFGSKSLEKAKAIKK